MTNKSSNKSPVILGLDGIHIPQNSSVRSVRHHSISSSNDESEKQSPTHSQGNATYDQGIINDYTGNFEHRRVTPIPEAPVIKNSLDLADQNNQNEQPNQWDLIAQSRVELSQINMRSAEQMFFLQSRLKELKEVKDQKASHQTQSKNDFIVNPIDASVDTKELNGEINSGSTFSTNKSSKTNIIKPREWSPSHNHIKTKSSKKDKNTRFSWADYSLSFVLLIISVALGFNLFFQYNQDRAYADFIPRVAGITEESDQIDVNTQIEQQSQAESSITQEEFEAWMNEHYPEEVDSVETNPNPQLPIVEQGIMELFGASTLGEVNKLAIDEEEISNKINTAQKKTDYIALAKRIDSYIATYRSYEAYDNQLATPLNGMTYIAVSEKTGMPIKYLMAISRAESRFGTDRFLASGNLTRPGQYLNACSIGLDDSGGNIGFASWEEGLEACGKWYQYFESKGVPDCRKWRIFNPNGDYCAKIETLSSEIDAYLKS